MTSGPDLVHRVDDPDGDALADGANRPDRQRQARRVALADGARERLALTPPLSRKRERVRVRGRVYAVARAFAGGAASDSPSAATGPLAVTFVVSGAATSVSAVIGARLAAARGAVVRP